MFYAATFCFLASSPASAQTAANPGTPHFVADLPLLDCDGTPCVEVKIGDGKPIRLLIDSGDVDSVLDAQAATLAKLPLEPDTRAPGMGRTTVAVLHLGSLALANLPFATMDVEKLRAANQLPHSAGTLAYPVFKDRILQLDFRRHRTRVSTKSPPARNARQTAPASPGRPLESRGRRSSWLKGSKSTATKLQPRWTRSIRAVC